jgi:hypothetical protein
MEIEFPEVSWEDKYAASLDSVALLNAGKPQICSEQEWLECEARNIEHLEIMLAQEWPEDFDLQPLNDALSE